MAPNTTLNSYIVMEKARREGSKEGFDQIKGKIKTDIARKELIVIPRFKSFNFVWSNHESTYYMNILRVISFG